MIDIKFLRENPEVVKENIKKKFQDQKLPLVDEVIELDAEKRKTQQEADELRANRNKLSKQIGALMGQGKKEEAEEVKKQVSADASRLAELEAKEKELDEKILKDMMTIPNIIDPSVPIGPDDSCNVEIEKFGFEDDRVILFAQRCEAYEDSDTANEAILTEYIELLEANISEEE